MQSDPGERYDFFLSRRGSVAPIAREVTDILTEKGYKILVQDYDIPLGASFVEAMHEPSLLTSGITLECAPGAGQFEVSDLTG